MRAVLVPLALVAALLPQATGRAPFVAVGVWYPAPGPAGVTADVEDLRRELGALRRAGFNAVTTGIRWRDAEPQPGAYALAGLERLAAVAAEADLKVTIVPYTDPRPAWAAGQTEAAARFVAYLTRRLALHSAVTAVTPDLPPDDPGRGSIAVRADSAPDARIAMWTSIARGEKQIAFAGADGPLGRAILSLGETAGVVTRNQALFAPLRPRGGGVVSVAGVKDESPVDVRLLESPEALVVVGVNPSRAPRSVTITFASDIPEAIWQNLETGSAVQFVMGAGGPYLEYTFGPRDALVLMIRKRLRLP